MCNRILKAMETTEWSTDNIAFGMGGALLQNLNRDTQSFAFKCSAIKKDDEWYPVSKSPITDVMKFSKAGKLKLQYLENSNHSYSYHTVNDNINTGKDCLIEVFRNGETLKEYTFEEVRNNTLK